MVVDEVGDSRFRPAVAADLPMILRAERDYIAAVEPDQQDAWTAAIDRNLALWIENLARTSVLIVDGQAGGFVMWTPEGDGSAAPAGLIVTIEVLPQFRRRGHARAMLELAARQVREQGRALLRLGVHQDNPARGLYETAGYHRTGRDGAYLLYERSLSENG